MTGIGNLEGILVDKVIETKNRRNLNDLKQDANDSYILQLYILRILWEETEDYALLKKIRFHQKNTIQNALYKNLYNLEQFLIAKVRTHQNEEMVNFFGFFSYQNFILSQMSIPHCPILKPTPKEFKNFHLYVQSLDKQYKNKTGMVKIVPPNGWKARNSDYTSSIDNFIIPGPIQQNTYGKGGVYQCLHIQKKSLSYKQYRKKTIPFDKITDGKSTQEVQDLFWKNIAFSPPLYGADIQISLMEPCSGSWNLGKLESLLTYALQCPIKGVNTPYCYVGSWKTLFCWHTEDLQLSAINYVHQGKSKFWYSIPEHQHHIIEKQAKSLFSQHFSKCSEHLRHKTTVINPYHLKSKYPELQITKAQHKAGQFILVFGGAYHCGFNFGFNLAEAVNYATLSWLKQFVSAKSCKCHNDSVKINQNSVLQCLQNSIFKNTKEVQQFRELISETVEQEQSQTMIQRDAIKKVFKKISKSKKPAIKLTYKGQKYDIDSWYQCDKCNKWRRSSKIISDKQKFYCKAIKLSCKAKQQKDPEFITI